MSESLAEMRRDHLLRWILDAELDIRYLDAQLGMRGEGKATNQKALRYKRADLARHVHSWSLALEGGEP